MNLIIPNYTLITILILISWLLTMSFVLIYSLLYKRMAYKIDSYKRILQYFSLYGIVFLMIILVFYLRYLRINYVLNFFEVYAFIRSTLDLILPQDLIILGLLLLITFIFCSLLLINFYARLKQTL